MRIEDLFWNDDNVGHLWAAHQVTPDEIEEIILGVDGEEPTYRIKRDGDFYLICGETGGGRLLKVVGEFIEEESFSRLRSPRHETARTPRVPQEEIMMPTHAKSKAQVAEALLVVDRPEDIEQAEIVRAGSRVSPPTSIRLSAPLLEAIDRLAATEHRKRGNMIQHILWEYVHRHASNVAVRLTKKRAS